MIQGILKLCTVGLAVVMLAGCDTTQGVGQLFASDPSADGPDEFAILPTKPLELPDDLTALPDPEPGKRNLVDPLPEHDAVAALGGQPARLDSDRVGAGEGALLNAAGRNGTAANIREQLAKEDKEVRRRNGPLFFERIFKTNTYLRTYENQTLEARRETGRLRRLGVRTPTVPPSEDE